MYVLVLGGTGTIGRPLIAELVARGHQVAGLTRSPQSAALLAGLGAAPIFGDIRNPTAWVARLPKLDAVVHAATDFAADMGDVDTRLLDGLLPALHSMGTVRFVYTGGCWLYGPTGEARAREDDMFNPPEIFAWMATNVRRVISSDLVEGMVVHPALVFEAMGGVLAQFLEPAGRGEPLTIIGNRDVRWPLVHAEDLARLYALVIESGSPGQSYNAAGIESMPVNQLALAIAQRFAISEIHCIAPEVAAIRFGEVASCYAIDQSLSAARARGGLNWSPRYTDPLAVMAG